MLQQLVRHPRTPTPSQCAFNFALSRPIRVSSRIVHLRFTSATVATYTSVSQQPQHHVDGRHTCPAIAFASSTAIVADISRSKDTVKQPQSHPVWCMLPSCSSSIKQSSLNCTSSCVLPCIDDCSAAHFGSNVMPEEWWGHSLVVSSLLDEIGSI